ncbi:phospholipase D-like domain-containing protein [Sediminicola luteus]|uniref:Phospholipase D-like domain-containing protein n=1 Tax=Sediminicola luteus TaxID=319238 RepID=A0ABV2TZA1_9FLAO
MKIERSNILELIGTGKNKYHSCVITSYSIDLAFFEQLILPRLRNVGITNINLFVDASMLEKYLASHLSSSSKKFKANYSITPVHIVGAFHPKMLFLAGLDKGYLSIGSGNITSSGLLYNDEIWSSFYTGKERTDTQPVFNSAWNYIQTLSLHCFDINRTKIGWINQHSPWLNKLDNISNLTKSIKDAVYKLSYTQKDHSLYKDVISELSINPKSIKIIAPYFNRSGAFLQTLIDDLSPTEMHCVVDKENGLLPVDFKSSKSEFSDWSDVIKNENSKSIQRLHAKMIQIEYAKETIFILGSANATVEAYGISNRSFKNDEAVITIKSEKPRDFLKELGINIPKLGTLNIQQAKNVEIQDLEFPKFLIRIKHAELNDQNLKLTLDKSISEPYFLRTFNNANELIEKFELSSESTLIQTTLIKTEGVFKVGIFALETLERISTFGLIQNTNVLKKSNPDERLARLQSFEHLDIFNSLNYELVLDFLDQERIFKESATAQYPSIAEMGVKEDEGEIISEREYNKNASLALDEQVTSENITSLVEEFLDVLKIRENQEEISSNSEEKALNAGDDGIDENTTLKHTQKDTSTKEGQRITHKIEKTIKSVYSLILARYQIGIPQETRSLNALFIGYHILLHFWEETYTEDISTIKIRYKKLKNLNKLENHFDLKRLESQIESAINEVSYTIDYSKLNKLSQFIDNQEEFKITGTPSEPITLHHPYINGKYIESYTDDNLIYNLLNNGVSNILRSIKNKELLLTETQKIKLLVLTNRILNLIKWKYNFEYYKNLFLLNLYEIIKAEELLLGNNIKDLKDIKDSDIFKQYTTYKMMLLEGKLTSVPLGSHLVNSIIYSTQLGFCKLKVVRKDNKIDLDSPLGESFNFGDYRGYFKVFVGQNIKLF